MTLPIVAARPSRAIKLSLWSTALRQGISDFAIVPALERPDLSPLEISARTTSRAAYRRRRPRPRPRPMAVPMRTVDQIEYAKKLPDPFHLGVAGAAGSIC